MTTRISVDVDDATWKTLQRNLPHGSRMYAYRSIIEGFAKALEAEGPTEILSKVMTYTLDFNRLIEIAIEEQKEGLDG